MIKRAIKYDVFNVYGTVYRYNPAVGVHYYNAFLGTWHRYYMSLEILKGNSLRKLIARNVVFKNEVAYA